MPSPDAYKSYEEVSSRLDDIVSEVKGKEISLEKSLDLFEEAISLSSKAVTLIDKADYSAQELVRFPQDGEAEEKEG